MERIINRISPQLQTTPTLINQCFRQHKLTLHIPPIPYAKGRYIVLTGREGTLGHDEDMMQKMFRKLLNDPDQMFTPGFLHWATKQFPDASSDILLWSAFNLFCFLQYFSSFKGDMQGWIKTWEKSPQTRLAEFKDFTIMEFQQELFQSFLRMIEEINHSCASKEWQTTLSHPPPSALSDIFQTQDRSVFGYGSRKDAIISLDNLTQRPLPRTHLLFI